MEQAEHETVLALDNLPLALPIAGVGPRLIAGAVDYAVVGALGLALVVAGLFLIAAMPARSAWVIAALILGFFLIEYGYFAAFESLTHGQTLGKKLLGIKVVRIESPDRLGMGRSWRRWSPMGIPVLLWSCLGVGFLLQFLDCLFVAIDRPLHQAWHDKSAATVVVEVPRSRKTPLENATSGGQDAHPR